MDFINLNFEVRNKNLNSDDKKDVKNKKDIPTGENIQSNLAKPNSETLKAYRGVVAFKGNSSPLENSINAIARSLFPKSPNNIDLIKNIVYSFDFKTQQFVCDTNNKEISSEPISDEKTKEISSLVSVLNQIKEKRIKEIDNLLNANPKSLTNDVKDAANSLFGDENNTINDIENKKKIARNAIKTAIFAEKLGISANNSTLNKIYKLVGKNLNPEQVSACLSCDVASDEDIKTFTELQKREFKKQDGTTITLSSTEAAIFTKRKAEDSFVDKYLELKSHQEITYKDKTTSEDKTYNLSSYEMMQLAERNFNAQEIKRYVQIKTLPIEIEGVRQQTRAINLTTEQALKYAETDKLDEEIKAEFKLYELVNKGIDLNSAIVISQSPLMDMLKKVDDNGKPLYSPADIVKYAKLGLTNEKQVEAYNQLMQNPDMDKTTILKIAKDGKIENVATYNELMAQNLSIDEAIKIADDEKRYERFQNLLNSQTQANIEDVVELASLGVDGFEQLERFYALKQKRPDIHANILIPLAKHPEYEKLYELVSLKNKNNEPLYSCAFDVIAREMNVNKDVSCKDFIKRVQELSELRKDLSLNTISKLANHSKYDELQNFVTKSIDNKYTYTDSDLKCIVDSIEINPKVSTKNFIARAKELKQKRPNIYTEKLAKISNNSEYDKLLQLADLYKNDKNTNIDSHLGFIAENIGKNPEVSTEDFIARAKELKQKRPDIAPSVLAQISNHSEYDKLRELATLSKDGEYIYTNPELTNIADIIGINPEIATEDFIARIEELKQKRPDIAPYVLAKISNHSECDKLQELATLSKDGEFIYSNLYLRDIVNKIETNPEVSTEDFIARAKELKQKRPDIAPSVLAQISNHSECDKLQELATLSKDGEYIYSNLDINNIANFIKTNPEVSTEDFIARAKELKQKRPDIAPYVLAQISNHSEYDKLRELATLSKDGEYIYTYPNLNSITCSIGINPEIATEDFIARAKELKQKRPDIAPSVLAKISNHSEYTNILNLINQGVEPNVALKVYSEEKYLNLINCSRKLTPKEVAFLTLHTPIDTFDLSLTSKLGKEVLTILNTGVTSDIVEAFCIANKNILSGQVELENLSEDDIPNKLIHIMSRKNKDTNENEEPKPYDASTYRYDENNGTFTFDGVNGKNGFSVELNKTTENGKTLLVATNIDNETEKYISYNGVIARVKLPELVEKDENGNPLLDENGNFVVKEEKHKNAVNSFKNYARLCPEQADILSEAAQNFIVNIFEDNGECIIGKGLTLPNGEKISPIDGSNMTDSEIEAHYKKVLSKLGDNLSIENILRLMPQNAMISINPYTTDDVNMLYSIGVEWNSKSNNQPQKLWKMRVHTQDLKFIDDPKNWIYRLGYQEKDKEYYYNPKTNNFEMGSAKEETHVEATTDDSNFNNSLIANPHFQNIIRQIKVAQNAKFSNLGNVAQKLGIQIERNSSDDSSSDDKKNKKIKPNEEENIVYSIIDKCCKDASLYIKYKNEIDTVINDFGVNLF